VKNGVLRVYSNGEMNYSARGVHVKVSDSWQFEGPPGSGDTHFSIMRGTKADLRSSGARAEVSPCSTSSATRGRTRGVRGPR
jgi:hypothetical protein